MSGKKTYALCALGIIYATVGMAINFLDPTSSIGMEPSIGVPMIWASATWIAQRLGIAKAENAAKDL